MKRLAKTVQACRPMPSPKTLIPSYAPSRPFHRPLSHRSFEQHIHSYASRGQWGRSTSEAPGLFSVPAVLVGLFGIGLKIAHADAVEGPPAASLPSESPSSHVDLEEIARKDRERLEELLKSKGMQYGSYPRFTIAVKGQKVTIKFQIPPNCEIPLLIANLVSTLGLKDEDSGVGSDMILRAWDSAVAWQLTLSRPGKGKQTGEDQGNMNETNAHDEDLYILLFRSLISSDKVEIEFLKRGSFSHQELDALVSVLQLAGQTKMLERKTKGDTAQKASVEKSVASLEAMGVRIYGLNEPNFGYSKSEISWDNIAGYDRQKSFYV